MPAQRGVSASDRATLAYALWRYGATTDDRTAAAMFLLTHLLSADPDFGSTTLESTVLGSDWPDPPAVMARAREILDESRARRGPWTIDVDVARAADGGAGGTVTAELSGPGGPIGGVDVMLTIDVGTADGDTRDVVLETGDDGRVTHALDVTDVGPLESGDVDRAGASDVTEAGSPDAGGDDVVDADADAGDHPDMLDHEVALVAVMVTAEVVVTPGGYRVFHGRPGTQQVITDAGNGPPVAASTAGEITVPLPPPPVTTTTVPATTTTTVVTTTTVPVTTTTVPPTTTTAPEPPPTVAPPTTVAPAAPAPVPERPARPASVAEPVLADTGGGAHLAPVGLLIVALGSTMVGAARRLSSVPASAWVPVSRWGRRRGGSHLRRTRGPIRHRRG